MAPRMEVGGIDLTVVGRMLLAAALVTPTGIDREVKGKPAGIRSHVLLAAAAAALGWLSITAAEGDRSADPTRIASYTVAGISFVGAGLIISVRARVHGLTTAIGMFVTTAIGLLTGMGYLAAAVTLAVVSLVTLAPLDTLKRRVYGQWVRSEVTLTVLIDDADAITEIHSRLGDLELRRFDVTRLDGGKLMCYLTVRGLHEQLDTVNRQLDQLPDVRDVRTIAA